MKINKKQGIARHPLARIFTDRTLRLRITLAAGLLFNLAYVLYNLLPALLYGSIWAISSTVYYLSVAIVRAVLIYRARRTASPYRTVLRIGIALLVLDAAIVLMIAYTAAQGRTLPYPPYYVVGYALFTLYSLTSSSVRILSSLRRDAPIAFATGNLTLTVAITSTYSLQHSLLVALGATASELRSMGILTATFIAVAVPTVAVSVILTALSRLGDPSPNPPSRV